MSEWWSYRPNDFLLFSPRVYWRMFELHNAALWPLQVLTLAFGLAVLTLMLWRPDRLGRWAAVLLAVLWVFVGWAFMWGRYATINWAAVYVAPAFWLQALLLAAIGIVRGLAIDTRSIAGWGGLMLIAVGVVICPLLPPLFGRPWTSAEVFGIAPDPTAFATLGFACAARDRLALMLFPIPLLWLLLSWLTLRTMGEAQAWLPFATVLVAVAIVTLRLRKSPMRAERK